MALRSKRDNKDYNGNEVYVQVGQYKVFQNILSLTCWDDEGNEYSIKSLLEKIHIAEQNYLTSYNSRRFQEYIKEQNS